MTNGELKGILNQYDDDLQVLVEGSEELKVCFEQCKDSKPYLRIIKPWNVDMVCPAKEIAKNMKGRQDE